MYIVYIWPTCGGRAVPTGGARRGSIRPLTSPVSDHPVMGGIGLSRLGGNLGFRV